MTSDISQIIEAWDFSNIVRRLINIKGWSHEQAQLVEREYRKYLVLLANNPGKRFPVPELVDEFGHLHLLFTSDADRFERETGLKLEHMPLQHPSDAETLRDDYEKRTLPAIRKLSGGDVNRDVWSNRVVCLWGIIRPV